MSRPVRATVIIPVAISIATVAAVAMLWPNGDRPSVAGPLGDTLEAEVVEVAQLPCPPPTCATVHTP